MPLVEPDEVDKIAMFAGRGIDNEASGALASRTDGLPGKAAPMRYPLCPRGTYYAW